MKKIILTLLLILLTICIVGCTGELTDSLSSSLSFSSVEQSSASSSEIISSSSSEVSSESSIQESISSSEQESSSISSAISSSSSSSEEVVCVSLSISGQKTTFTNGEEFSTGNLVVTATMSNNTSKTLTAQEYVVDSSAYNKNTQGSYNITITALGKTAFYSVTVGEPYVVSLAISGQKTEFDFGESFSIGSLVVTATMSNGSTKNVTASTYVLDYTSYNATKAGEYTIKVSYADKQQTYTVTVKEDSNIITGITISGQKTSFAFAEDFNVGGLVVKANMSNGATKTLTSSEYTVDYSGYNCMQAKTYTITVSANGTEFKKTYTATVNVAEKLKVLMIGNSFAEDTINYVYEIATSLGISASNFSAAHLYIAGCTLDTHWDNAQNDYSKYYFAIEGNGNTAYFKDTSNNYITYTLKQGIEYDKWDFITFQQGSAQSGVESKYSNLANLMNYVRNIATDTTNNPNANPNVKFVWNQTWAYQNDFTGNSFNTYGGTGHQMDMYNAIINCVKTQVLTKSEFVAMIPSGTAVQNARTSYMGDTFTRDGYHLNKDYGRYIASLNLVKVLTGRDITNVAWKPSAVDKDMELVCKESVNNANLKPLEITKSSYAIPDVSNMTLFDWKPVDTSYWNTSSTTGKHNVLYSGDSTSKKFVSSSVMFTKQDIPVGSVILIESGWRYRAEGWNANQDPNGTGEGQSGIVRPGNITTTYVIVTEEWWGDFVYRAFNVSKTDGTDLTADDLVTAKTALKIYVPSTLFKGNGTEASPYLIETEQDLINLSNASFGKNYGSGLYFKLVNDITVQNNWQPICFNGVVDGWPSSWYSFAGIFDGNNKTITFTINQTNAYGVGLFAGLSGTVKNLTIKGTITAKGYVGGVAGRLYTGAVIDNVTNYVNITATNNQIGGIAGNAADRAVITITNCKNYGTITTTGTKFIAGILGGGWSCTQISNCANYGNITGVSYVAGIVGEIYTSFAGAGVTNSTNTGVITAGTTIATTDNGSDSLYVGNIVGKLN